LKNAFAQTMLTGELPENLQTKSLVAWCIELVSMPKPFTCRAGCDLNDMNDYAKPNDSTKNPAYQKTCL